MNVIVADKTSYLDCVRVQLLTAPSELAESVGLKTPWCWGRVRAATLLFTAALVVGKYQEKLIFDPSAQKTARLFDLQSIFASAPEVDHGEFF